MFSDICFGNFLVIYTFFFLFWFQPADIYLIDEPSAYLDSEQRIVASKVIKRFILHAKKTAFVVEHDFIMATYLADRVIVYEGRPSIDCIANSPQSLLTGMNLFLSVSHINFPVLVFHEGLSLSVLNILSINVAPGYHIQKGPHKFPT